ncbi:hypothetical protein KSP39_PZI010591 [Platanthera zijinensis]|uniref:Uncharacterized protein n=1 Tax=Platanthera zijinensis TaxID=2320716 RepID=A0AAP0G705_9ASPA
MQGSGGRRLLHISCCMIKSRLTIYHKDSLSPFFLLHNSHLHNSSSFYSKPEKNLPLLFFRRCPSWTSQSPLAVFSRVSLQNQSPSSSSVCAGRDVREWGRHGNGVGGGEEQKWQSGFWRENERFFWGFFYW